MRGMKNLLYITSWYPQNYGDSAFIKTEIKYLSQKFNSIVVLSHGKRNDFEADIPDNTKVFFFKEYPKIISWLLLPSVLVEKSVFSEMLILWRKKLFSVKNLKKLLLFYVAAVKESWQIKKIIRDFDISVCYTFWFHFSTLGCIFAKRHMGFTFKPMCATRTHGFDLYEERSLGWQPFKKFMDRNLDGIFFISLEGKNYYSRVFACGVADKYHLAYLGTDNFFTPKEYECSTVLRIVSCSYVVAVKRLHLIIDALLKSCENGTEIEWTHIGGGEDFDEIFSYAQEKLGGKVKFQFVGHKDNLSVLEFYASHSFDLFINLSESEGLPVSMMEESSFGIPIIATDVGGVSEIVCAENGFIVNSDNCVEEAADTICRFDSLSFTEKKEMRKNARAMWENRFNATNNYLNFAQKLLELAEF